MVTTYLFSKALWSVAGAAIISGGAGAAYAGVLPHSLQQLAHQTIGAPATEVVTQEDPTSPAPTTQPSIEPSSEPTASSTEPSSEPQPTQTTTPSPSVTSEPETSAPETKPAPADTKVKPAKAATDKAKLHGLCNALQHGGLPAHSAAYAKLAAAAGSMDKDTVAAFCTSVAHPKMNAASNADKADKTKKTALRQQRAADRTAAKAEREQARTQRKAEHAASKTARIGGR